MKLMFGTHQAQGRPRGCKRRAQADPQPEEGEDGQEAQGGHDGRGQRVRVQVGQLRPCTSTKLLPRAGGSTCLKLPSKTAALQVQDTTLNFGFDKKVIWFRLKNLKDPAKKWKLEKNAQQLYMTGTVIRYQVFVIKQLNTLPEL